MLTAQVVNVTATLDMNCSMDRINILTALLDVVTGCPHIAVIVYFTRNAKHQLCN